MKYSVVIPLKDEEENIGPLIEEVERAMEPLCAPWELICVDDGSQDRTVPFLEELKKKKPYLHLLEFTKNFGQSSAFDAGFKEARGEFVITLDGDGQNDPQDIPKLLKEIEQADLVCGQRKRRKDSLTKRLISRLANRVRSFLLHDGIPDSGCSLKVYRREALKKIKLYHGLHRFLPALFQIEGFKIVSIPVNHRPRLKGKTKYTLLNRQLNTIFDLLAVSWMRKRQLRYEIKGEEKR